MSAVPYKQRLAAYALLEEFLLDHAFDSEQATAKALRDRTGVDVTPQCVGLWRRTLLKAATS